MKTIKKSIFAVMAVVAGISLTTACSDANEFEDTDTNNKSWVSNYTDSTATLKHLRERSGYAVLASR